MNSQSLPPLISKLKTNTKVWTHTSSKPSPTDHSANKQRSKRSTSLEPTTDRNETTNSPLTLWKVSSKESIKV